MRAHIDVNVLCPGCGNLMHRGGLSLRLRDKDKLHCFVRGCVYFGKAFAVRAAPEVELVEIAPGPAIERVDLYDQKLAQDGGV